MRFSGIAALAMAAFATACPPPTTSPVRLATGTTPNAVTAIACADGPRLLVAASAEARLDILDPDGVAPARSVFLGAGSTPWDVAVVRQGDGDGRDGDDARAVVTLSGSHALALVQPCGDAPALLDVVVDLAPFDLPTRVTLRDAADVDGDGAAELEVTRMRPRAPQAVVAVGDTVVVAWANTLAFATGPDAPMLTGPGLLSHFVIDDDDGAATLRSVARTLVPCENPGGLAVVDEDTVAVSCAGRYALGAAGYEKAGPGGLALVDLTTMSVTTSTSLPGAPGPLLVADGALLSGDLLDGALHQHALVDLAVRSTHPGRTDLIDSAFALAIEAGGVVVAGWFDGRVTRDPFGAATTTAAPPGPPRGLIDLVHDGERLWGLHTLSAELVVIPEAP